MPRLIKAEGDACRICEDTWHMIKTPEEMPAAIPPGALIVSLSLWQERRSQWLERGDTGVVLASDESADALAQDCARLPLIAVDFPALTDGRGFSTGRQLREHYGFTGEMRAVGAIIRDQLFYLRRCGFDAFLLLNQEKLEEALQYIDGFPVSYQGATDERKPLFRRR